METDVKFRIWATKDQRITYFYDCREGAVGGFLQQGAIRFNRRMKEVLIFEIK